MSSTALKFTRDHEWVRLEADGSATVGITPHAQDALGDVVFVDLPQVGATLAQGATAGVVESVKAAADVYMPLSGEILAVNDTLRDEPALVNSAPMAEGWFFKMRPTAPAELDALMDEAAYGSFAASN
jgi:glycine cleavage system H protein